MKNFSNILSLNLKQVCGKSVLLTILILHFELGYISMFVFNIHSIMDHNNYSTGIYLCLSNSGFLSKVPELYSVEQDLYLFKNSYEVPIIRLILF